VPKYKFSLNNNIEIYFYSNMNGIDTGNSKDIFEWFNWLNNKWNNYEAFIQYEDGVNPKEVAENFLDLNKGELSKFFEALDKEDIDALDQMQKLTESEFHVFKIIREQVSFRKKVRFVDFRKDRK
tara:strand:- start:125 stop:499 length:375 start_codon:yes stop_codon:yes gene_type:complete